MTWARPALLLLQHRGLSARWALLLAAAWLVALGCSRVAVPRVGPEETATNRALEQLGAIGLCLPVIVLTLMLVDGTEWLTRTSPRSRRLVRLSTACLVTVVGLATAALAASVYPADVRWVRVVGLFWLLLSLAVLIGALVDGVWAALAGPLLIALHTFRGVVPWEQNLVYNPETDTALLVGAALAQLAALCVSALAPDRRAT